MSRIESLCKLFSFFEDVEISQKLPKILKEKYRPGDTTCALRDDFHTYNGSLQLIKIVVRDEQYDDLTLFLTACMKGLSSKETYKTVSKKTKEEKIVAVADKCKKLLVGYVRARRYLDENGQEFVGTKYLKDETNFNPQEKVDLIKPRVEKVDSIFDTIVGQNGKFVKELTDKAIEETLELSNKQKFYKLAFKKSDKEV